MMAGKQYELNPVSHITTGAIGPAGKRVFYLQARSEAEVVTLIVEKAQVTSLAIGLEQYLLELQERYPTLEEASPGFDESVMALEVPLDPAFRVGQFGLGYDETSDRLVLLARELQLEGADPEEAGVARFWCTRSQLRAMCRWGIEVAGRGRPICGNCGEPIDPEGHFCPKRNGHKH
jgi:uncharacterized repeat protein (TIGR03847 family)